jgi:predicted secreted protein
MYNIRQIKPVWVFSLACLVTWVTGGAWMAYFQPNPGEMETLHIKKDSIVLVRLKSAATAGFVWFYSIEDSAIASVQQRDSEFSGPSARVGDSGQEVFAVKGLKIGVTKVFFEQKRPSKNSGKPVRTKMYLIRVH